jgi:hypothetical protein
MTFNIKQKEINKKGNGAKGGDGAGGDESNEGKKQSTKD